MLRQLARDTGIYTVSVVAARFFSLLMLPVYARSLKPSQLGDVDMLLMFGGIAGIVIGLEIGQGFARYHAEAKTPTDARLLASTAFWFTAATFTLFALAATPFAEWIGLVLLKSHDRADLVRVALAAIWTQSVLQIMLTHLRYGLQPPRFAMVSFVATAITVGTTCALLWLFHLGPKAVMAGMIVGNVSGMIIGLLWSKADIVGAFDVRVSRMMLGFSIPLVPAGLAGVLGSYIDRLSIQRLMTQTDVGVFGAGFRIASTCGILLVGFQMAFVPLVYKNADQPEVRDQVGRVFRYFIAAAGVFSLVLGFASPYVARLLLTPAYAGSAGVIPLLCPALIVGTMTMFAPGLALAKRTHTLAAIVAVGAFLNAAFNIVLVPLLGIRGAATSTLLAGMITFTVMLTISQRHFAMTLRAPSLIMAGLVTLGGCAAASYLEVGGFTGLAVRLVLALVGVLAVLSLTVSRDELNRVIRKLSSVANTKLETAQP